MAISNDSTNLKGVSTSVLPGRSERRRAVGLKVGLFVAALAWFALWSPSLQHWTAPGSMNRGHEATPCNECHREAPGSVRQQLQANARYLLGLRETAVDFGKQDVGNGDCLACHERPFDRHPVFRFNEPRFAEARAQLAPHQCVTCHREHSGRRVTVELGFCQQCHWELELENDPLDVSHRQLIDDRHWQSCLGCHDFHGNHEMNVPDKLEAAHAEPILSEYFAGGASPYSTALKARAKRERGSDDAE